MPRPVIHGRDHEHAGADPVRIVYETVGSPGGGGFDTFVITAASTVSLDDNPIALDYGDHFYTAAAASFDLSGGQARILRSGFYVITLYVRMHATGTISGGGTEVEVKLAYGGDVGYGIEGPYLGFPGGAPSEFIATSTIHFFDDGGYSDFDFALHRTHPISLTDSAAFPVAITPAVYSGLSDGTFAIEGFAVWGYRLGDALDAYHSD